MSRRCSECGQEIDGRADRQTCSDRCRMARSRRLDSPTSKIIVLPPDPVRDAAALLERWLYVGSMDRVDIDTLERQTEAWIREQA